MIQQPISPEAVSQIFNDIQNRLFLIVLEYRDTNLHNWTSDDSIPYLRVWELLHQLERDIQNGNYKFKSADGTHE
jgi:hypothetical protein